MIFKAKCWTNSTKLANSHNQQNRKGDNYKSLQQWFSSCPVDIWQCLEKWSWPCTERYWHLMDKGQERCKASYIKKENTQFQQITIWLKIILRGWENLTYRLHLGRWGAYKKKWSSFVQCCNMNIHALLVCTLVTTKDSKLNSFWALSLR